MNVKQKIQILMSIAVFAICNTTVLEAKKVQTSYKKKAAKTDKTFNSARSQLADHQQYSLAKKKLVIAILAPFTGSYKNIGKHMSESALMAAITNNVTDFVIINFDTKGTAEGAKEALGKIIKNKINIVIGPALPQEADEIHADLEKYSKISFFSPINNNKYTAANFFVFGSPKSLLTGTMANYLKNVEGRSNISFILPKSQEGFKDAQQVKESFKEFGFKTFSIVYIDDNNISKSINQITSNSSILMYQDPETQELHEKNFRQKYSSNGDKSYEEELVPVMQKLDTVWISDKIEPSKMSKLFAKMNTSGLLLTEVTIATIDTAVDKSFIKNPLTNSVVFASASALWNENKIENIEKIMRYKLSRFSTSSFDIMLAIAASSYKGKINNSKLFDESGFNGITGQFRFLPNGYVQRIPSVYKIRQNSVKNIYQLPEYV